MPYQIIQNYVLWISKNFPWLTIVIRAKDKRLERVEAYVFAEWRHQTLRLITMQNKAAFMTLLLTQLINDCSHRSFIHKLVITRSKIARNLAFNKVKKFTSNWIIFENNFCKSITSWLQNNKKNYANLIW